MSDVQLNTIAIIDIDAGSGEEAHVTNAGFAVTHEGTSYTPMSALSFKSTPLTGDMGTKEYKVKGISVAGNDLLTRISQNVPYPKVAVNIRELSLNNGWHITSESWLYKGLLYQVKYRPIPGYLDLILQDYKYYLDRTGGIPCTEQCGVPFFGDEIQCKATVQTEQHVLESASGFLATLATDPVLTTSFLFNSGSMSFGASRIKIQYHETGRVFQLSRRIPSYWLGQIVTITTGCDKQLATCRDIHDNEERFLGLGFSMVDYNPYYENP